MKKRLLAFLLVLVMAASLSGVASAAELVPVEKVAQFHTQANAAYSGLVAQAQSNANTKDTRANNNYIIPAPWSFGQTVVVGQKMLLDIEINDEGVDGGYIIAEIYKGTFDSVGGNDKPIGSIEQNAENGNYTLQLGWETKGLTEGNYVVFYGIIDKDYNVVTASYADLYLSKTEIPLTSVDIFVYELDVLEDEAVDSTPEKVLADVNTQFSVALNYEPYHTTADRKFTMSTSGSVSAADATYVYGTGVATAAEPGTGTVTLSCGNVSDTMTVYVKNLGNHAVTPVTAHELDPETMTVIKEPTATKDGEATGTCTICGEEVTVVLPRVFSDTNGEQWYSDAVDYCYENELVNGVADHQFAPSHSLTRGQLVTILYRMEGNPETEGTLEFTDVTTGSFYSDAVLWASKNQIVNGYENGTYQPNRNITREQLATMLFRYVQYKDADNGSRSDLVGFEDAGKISSYAKEAFQWAVENEIVNGVTATRLKPYGQATRAQAAQLLYKLAAYLTLAPEVE